MLLTKGNLWVGLQNQGLMEAQTASMDDFTISPIKSHHPNENLFTPLVCDSKGRIWTTGKNYVGYYNGDQ